MRLKALLSYGATDQKNQMQTKTAARLNLTLSNT